MTYKKPISHKKLGSLVSETECLILMEHLFLFTLNHIWKELQTSSYVKSNFINFNRTLDTSLHKEILCPQRNPMCKYIILANQKKMRNTVLK